MTDYKSILTVDEAVCAEISAPPSGLVVFGASGDLTRRKLLGSLFELFRHDLLPRSFYFLGCGRKSLTDAQFQEIAEQAIRNTCDEIDDGDLKNFIERVYFASGEYDNAEFYKKIMARQGELDRRHDVKGNYVYYLAVPPGLYGTIARHLGEQGFNQSERGDAKRGVKLLIEKPFGRDLQTAVELNAQIGRYFDESQIYRIDHYLGKETVQNILMLRFANAIFEPIWNRNYIDHIQITIAESAGIEGRAGYYDSAGALRDMFQNHMLSMVALAAMEPPGSFQAESIRDEKVKLLRAIHPFVLEPWETGIIRGQYRAGMIDGKAAAGYRDEEGVRGDSKTETYVCAKILIDNWRWKTVPFYVRTGKRLLKKITEIAIVFKKVPHSMFASSGIEELPANELILKIQPKEGIQLSFQAKRPGSKSCMSILHLNFNYSDVFGSRPPDAYERLLLDCMLGDQTLFTRQDDVEVSWRLLKPVLEAWEGDESLPHEYEAGCESFAAADALPESDGGSWRSLSRM
ncbi:MAG: glucose-6-phosphate dehydrogenase [Planctomycetota bacterium]